MLIVHAFFGQLKFEFMISDCDQTTSSIELSYSDSGSLYDPKVDLENNSDTPIEISDNSFNSFTNSPSANNIIYPNSLHQPIVLLQKIDFQLNRSKMEKLKELNSLLQSVDSFSGSSKNVKLDFDKFCNAVDLINYVVKDDKTSYSLFMKLLKTILYDSAYEIVRYNNFESWSDLKDALSIRFIQRRSQGVVASELVNCNQSKNENVLSYASNIQKLLDELNEICISNQGQKSASTIQKYNEILALNSFLNGLRNPHLRTIVKSYKFDNLSEATEKALDEEICHKPSSNDVVNCKYCGKKGHTENNCFKKENAFKPKSKVENPASSPASVDMPNPHSNNTKKLFCVYCHKNGHIVQNCFKKQNKNNSGKSNENVQSVSVNSNSNNVQANTSVASLVVPSENYQRPEQTQETVRVDGI